METISFADLQFCNTTTNRGQPHNNYDNHQLPKRGNYRDLNVERRPLSLCLSKQHCMENFLPCSCPQIVQARNLNGKQMEYNMQITRNV